MPASMLSSALSLYLRTGRGLMLIGVGVVTVEGGGAFDCGLGRWHLSH